MTSLEHLLPAPDESVRCAEHSRTLAVDPGGSAIRADRVILVETPLPWPKPVFGHPSLTEITPILKGSTLATRTLACVPDAGAAADATADVVGAFEIGIPRLIVFDRSYPQVVERRFRPSSQRELVELAHALATDRQPTIDAMAESVATLVGPVLLVCTQGSHDVCCGSEGARFAAEAETIDDLTVYRVSHTGGHRFAPTAMTLPDGRMWSDLDLDLLRQVLSRTGSSSDVLDHCRGWWGAETGPAQMAERAVFARMGWALENHNRSIEAAEQPDGAMRCLVSIEDRSWQVTVAARRTVPSIACRQPGGLPAKPSVEYEVRQIVEKLGPVGD